MEWQPIETAPKDGRPITVTDGKIFATVRWRKGADAMRAQWAIYGMAVYECWYETLDFEPTLWMPLLEPPNPDSGTKVNPDGSVEVWGEDLQYLEFFDLLGGR